MEGEKGRLRVEALSRERPGNVGGFELSEHAKQLGKPELGKAMLFALAAFFTADFFKNKVRKQIERAAVIHQKLLVIDGFGCYFRMAKQCGRQQLEGEYQHCQ